MFTGMPIVVGVDSTPEARRCAVFRRGGRRSAPITSYHSCTRLRAPFAARQLPRIRDCNDRPARTGRQPREALPKTVLRGLHGPPGQTRHRPERGRGPHTAPSSWCWRANTTRTLGRWLGGSNQRRRGAHACRAGAGDGGSSAIRRVKLAGIRRPAAHPRSPAAEPLRRRLFRCRPRWPRVQSRIRVAVALRGVPRSRVHEMIRGIGALAPPPRRTRRHLRPQAIRRRQRRSASRTCPANDARVLEVPGPNHSFI